MEDRIIRPLIAPVTGDSHYQCVGCYADNDRHNSDINIHVISIQYSPVQTGSSFPLAMSPSVRDRLSQFSLIKKCTQHWRVTLQAI